jgi:hypothetical protein
VLLSGLESLGPTKYKLYNEDCVSPLTVGSLENAKHCPNYDIYIYIYITSTEFVNSIMNLRIE